MKNSVKRTFRAGLVCLALAGTTLAAEAAGPKGNKAVQKAREMVEEAGTHDWLTLAKAAEKCFLVDQNLKEAYDWLQKSLEINETVYNLTLQGDYFLKNDLPRRAMSSYLKALDMGHRNIEEFDAQELEKKVWKVRNIIYPAK